MGPRLSRNVKVLSAVSLLQDAASEMLYPILPLFVTGVLGAPPVVLGLIEGVADATSAALKVVSGRMSDGRRKRPFIAAGYGLSALAKPAIGLASGWGLVLGARFVDRFGKGVRTSPRDALIAADSAEGSRGAAFGFHRAADSAGAVIGPLAGLALYRAMDGQLRPLFFAAFIPAFIAVVLVGAVRESAPPVARVRDEAQAPLGRGFWSVVAFVGVFGLVNFSDALVLLRASELGLGTEGLVLAYALYNVAYAALSYPAGRVSDRLGSRRVFGVGMLVFSLSYGGLGLISDAKGVWLLLPVYGAFTALTDGVGKAWVAAHLPAGSLGKGIGIFHGVSGGASLVAGLWAGAAWGPDGALPLKVSASVALLLAVVLMLRPPRSL